MLFGDHFSGACQEDASQLENIVCLLQGEAFAKQI